MLTTHLRGAGLGRRTARRVAAAALCLGVVLATALATSPAGAAANSLFLRLLKDPQNVALNLEYAREAERIGKHARAIATYERVLAIEPDNAEAQAAIARLTQRLKPDVTRVYAILGAQYETNGKRLGDDRAGFDDVMGSLRLVVDDQRRLWDVNWRSNVQFFGNLYGRFDDGDVLSFNGETGPEILVGAANLRPVVGVALVALDGEGYLRQLTVGAEWLPLTGVLKEVSLRGKHNEFANRFPGRDAWVLDAGARLEWRDLATGGDSLTLRPGYLFNGAGQSRYRYNRVDGAVDYRYPLGEDLRLVGGLTLAYRGYDGAYPGATEDREDWTIAPRVQLIRTNFFHPRLSATGYYQFQRNLSNDDTFDYSNHVFGGSLIWSF